MTGPAPLSSSPGGGQDGYLSPAPPRVIAHRGLATEAPENTLLAFLHALSVGAHYLETDVHATADGIAVLAHDPDLRRVAGRPEPVEQFTLAQLQTVDLGHGQTFPTLAEALDAFPEARFNIDVKSAAAVQPTIAAIRAADAQRRVLVTSFSERRRRAVARGLPGAVSSASAPRFAVALVAAKLGLGPLVRLVLRGLVAVQVPERAMRMRVTTPRVLSAMHRAGVEVHVWTINSPTRMRELLDLGADGIVTDRADFAMEVLAERGSS